MGHEQRDGLVVKGDEGLAAQPLPLEGDYAIGTITARRQHRRANLHRRAVDLDIGRRDQYPQGLGHVSGLKWVNTQQHPDEFT